MPRNARIYAVLDVMSGYDHFMAKECVSEHRRFFHSPFLHKRISSRALVTKEEPCQRIVSVVGGRVFGKAPMLDATWRTMGPGPASFPLPSLF